MLRIAQTVCTALIGSVLLACGNPTAADPPAQGSEDQIAFQHADLVVGEVLYACNSWLDGMPSAAERLVVDLFLIRESDRIPNIGPLEEQVRVIEEAGGEILHRFNVLGVRTEILPEAIPRLVGYWGAPGQRVANHARAVPRADRFDLEVAVGYSGSPEPLITLFEQLGGHVTGLFQISKSFHGVVPDSALPHLRATGRARFIQHNQIGCLQ